MKFFFLWLLLASWWQQISAQPNPADYFRLDVRYYEEDSERYLGVSPVVRPSPPGVLGKAMMQYPRRFRYLLSKTDYVNQYEKYYPDTFLIDRLYGQALATDTVFMRRFRAVAKPFVEPSFRRDTFTAAQLLQVAARFFYCDGVGKDGVVSSHICITLNGLQAAVFSRDLTVLEAFCFEAIFENYRQANGQAADYVQHFKEYIRAAEKKEKHLLPDTTTYLLSVRRDCFEKMEQDDALRQMLLQYYQKHQVSLSFVPVAGYCRFLR